MGCGLITGSFALITAAQLVERSFAAEGGHCICSPDARPVCTTTDLVSSEPGFRCVVDDGAVGRAIEIRDTEGLETIDLSGLNTTRGLRVSFNADLRSFAAPTLADSDGDVRIDFNNHLRAAQLPRLASVAGSLQVNLNAELAELDLGALEHTEERLLITGDKLTLAGVSLDIKSTVDLRKFPPPLARDPPARFGKGDTDYTHSTNRSIPRRAVQAPGHCLCPEQPLCTMADLLSSDGEDEGCKPDSSGAIERALVVRGNGQLRNLSLSDVTSLPGGLDIGENFLLETVTTPALIGSGELRVERNPALTNIESPQLATVEGDVHYLTNERLRSIEAPALASVSGAIEFRENYALEKLDLPRLATCASDLHVGYNNLIVAANLGDLQTVGGSLFVRDNFALRALHLANLTATADALLINANDDLKVTGTQLALAFELDLDSFPPSSEL